MGFWQNVDDELKYLGMSRKELAQKADFPDSYIPKGIKRNSVPAADLAVKIAHALNTSLESLLDMSESNEIRKPKNSNFIVQWERLSQAQQEKLVEFLEIMNK